MITENKVTVNITELGKCIMKSFLCDAYSQVLNTGPGTLVKLSNFFRPRRSLLTPPLLPILIIFLYFMIT